MQNKLFSRIDPCSHGPNNSQICEKNEEVPNILMEG
jgi:hypothetical protein